MKTRTIPTSIPALITHASRALAGLQTLGVTVGIAQNTAARTGTDYYDLVGEAGAAPTNRGKEADWQIKREELSAARAALRVTKAAAVKFCTSAVDLLKIHLGRTWNPAWEAAGFSQYTLTTKRSNPLPALTRIRAYLRDHPTRENVPLNVTAAQADVHIAAIPPAQRIVDAAIVASKEASAARSASAKKLGQRLSGLREELDLLLEATDTRWYEFGFSRPVDVRAPGRVTGLALAPAGAGKVLVQHKASARALDYRVSWKLQDGNGDPTEVGLFADLAVTLNDLPTGLTIVVSVTARNSAGETQPAEATIVVP